MADQEHLDKAVEAAVNAYVANEQAIPEALDAGCDLSELPSSLSLAVKAARPHFDKARAEERERLELERALKLIARSRSWPPGSERVSEAGSLEKAAMIATWGLNGEAEKLTEAEAALASLPSPSEEDR